MNLSVVIPALNEAENLKHLILKVKNILEKMGISYEIIIVDGGSKDNTKEIALELKVACVVENKPGYGRALIEGFRVSQGEFILTMDADFSHDPTFIQEMWNQKDQAELVIASRYVLGGSTEAPVFRKFLSGVLNNFFRIGWSIYAKDISSGFRLYKKTALDSLKIENQGYNILPEILIKMYALGYKIKEIPFAYKRRKFGGSHIKLLKFGAAYLKTFYKMWRLRNSIACADYDYRAYYSRIPLQRYWQRKRYEIVMSFIKDKNALALDAGCGSSKIIFDLPNAVPLDLNFNRLLFLRDKHKNLVNASVSKLPFKGGIFPCVICSEVIEHTKEGGIFEEFSRVLQDGGELIIGTPDYGRISWRIIERLYSFFQPGGYADEHITQYSYKTLKRQLSNVGFEVTDFKYVVGSELIIKARKIKYNLNLPI